MPKFFISDPSTTIVKGTADGSPFYYGGGGKARTYDLMHVKHAL